MADVRPFRGVHYNQQLVSDLSAVICPPYDIITPQAQEELYHRSEYNFVRLEYSREQPGGTSQDNRYTRAAATLAQWLKQGILKVDHEPAIYLHNHYFTHEEANYKRRSIFVCVRLEEQDKAAVRPHEGTLLEPKNDRLNLLRACQANTSPIFALFEDEGKRISSLLADQEQRQPEFSVSHAHCEGHKVWAITEPAVIHQIHHLLADKPIYIADGHHRYESALTYQREKRAQSSSVSGDEGFNFVMMALVEFSDPGLIILPPHRMVRGLAKTILTGLAAKLGAYFDIQDLPLGTPDLWEKVDRILTDEDETRLVLFGLNMENLSVLRLRDLAAAKNMMPRYHSDVYKKLDVSIVDHIVLEKTLGINNEHEQASLDYCYDKRSAVKKVLDQEYQLAFLLRPATARVIRAIADAGDKMPKKSTYFYPKLPSGLVFYRMA